jgi:uncharacterized protein with von Willebrand factor type A (vWA) domain
VTREILPAPPAASIETDSIDREAFARVRMRMPAMQSIEARGARLYPHMDAMLLDLWAALFKNVVVPREPPASASIGKEIVRTVVGSPDLEALRESTVLDEARAAAGVLVLAKTALSLLREEEVAPVEDLARAARLAREEDAIRREEEGIEEARDSAAALGEEARRRLDALARALEERKDALTDAEEEARRAAELPPEAATRLREAVRGLPDRMDRAEEEAEAWGRGVGAGGRVDAPERLALGDRIASSESLRRLAALAGAFRDLARKERRRRIARRAAETHDVVLGDDWARVLPVELAVLRHPALGRALRRRALDGELLTYRLDGPDDRGRGPLVVCLDGSGSMQGDRDLWAKAVTLALMDVARRQKRRCRVVSFSDSAKSIRTFDLLPPARGSVRRQADLGAVVRLAEHFPGGGTDFVSPLREALGALRQSGFRKGDVVFVTDGEADVPASLVAEIDREKRRLGFRIYGVFVDVAGAMPHGPETLARFCDDVTSVSRLTGESVRDLFVKVGR